MILTLIYVVQVTLLNGQGDRPFKTFSRGLVVLRAR